MEALNPFEIKTDFFFFIQASFLLNISICYKVHKRCNNGVKLNFIKMRDRFL